MQGVYLHKIYQFGLGAMLLLFALAGSLQMPALAVNLDFNQGMGIYQQKQYDKAIPYFLKALKAEPGNLTARFYLANALAQTKDLPHAKQAYEQVMQNTQPGNPLYDKAKRNLATITQAQITTQGNSQKAAQVAALQSQGGTNYISYAISDGQIMHWDPAKMPLKIFIADGHTVRGYDYSLRQLVSEAMLVWQGGSKGRLRFAITQRPDDADITVSWKERLNHSRIGESPFQSMDGKILRSDVTVGLYKPQGDEALGRDEIYRTIVHELGHALGIQGHSPDPADIMYFAVNEKQGNRLTLRDTNTITMLYALEADITNSSNMTVSQTRDFYNKKQTAVQQHLANNSQGAIQGYLDALQINPNDADILYNLGIAYEQQNDPAKAMGYYRKTLQIDNQKVNARYNLSRLLINTGVDYAKTNQLSKAKALFEEAVQHLEIVSRAQGAPADARQNLELAKRNLDQIRRMS